jgi:hypothetical protein
MSTDGIIGEHPFYQLDIYVFNERQGTYRIQVLDGADGFSSTSAGYTPEGIRERALELTHTYLLKRDGNAPIAFHGNRQPIYFVSYQEIPNAQSGE